MLDTKTKAFRRGFVAGLRSPYAVFSFERPRYGFRPMNFVALSWFQVGESIDSAIKKEGRIDEQRADGSVKAH